jgi:hypothetical protein
VTDGSEAISQREERGRQDTRPGHGLRRQRGQQRWSRWQPVANRDPEDQADNTTLAQYLWGYNFWTRAQQLRDLVRYFRSIGVVDQEQLKQWAFTSTFKNDFEGRVKGLGPAVYQWLVMRQMQPRPRGPAMEGSGRASSSSPRTSRPSGAGI